MHEEVVSILTEFGVISPSTHPHLANRIRHYAKKGVLRRILGDVYALPEAADSFEARVAAARSAYPNCTFIRGTAAKLTWWPELRCDDVAVSAPRRRHMRGFSFERRDIPGELRSWDGEHFLTSPALTVLDLTDSIGGTAIDEGLRRGAVTLADLHDALALTSGRPGNQERARLLAESRNEPWSPLEREAHVMLRRANFPGWVANHEVVIDNRTYFLDLAVPEFRLAAEIDGYEHHSSLERFVADRSKWNALTLAGWRILHFTAGTLPDLVRVMQEALRKRP